MISSHCQTLRAKTASAVIRSYHLRCYPTQASVNGHCSSRGICRGPLSLLFTQQAEGLSKDMSGLATHLLKVLPAHAEEKPRESGLLCLLHPSASAPTLSHPASHSASLLFFQLTRVSWPCLRAFAGAVPAPSQICWPSPMPSVMGLHHGHALHSLSSSGSTYFPTALSTC